MIREATARAVAFFRWSFWPPDRPADVERTVMNLEHASVLGVPGELIDDPDARAAVSRRVKQAVQRGERLIIVAGTPAAAVPAVTTAPDDLIALADEQAQRATRQAATLRGDLAWVGLNVVLLDPADVGPIARGHALSAEPRVLKVPAIAELAGDAPVIVLPGGVGASETGDAVSLGDGGDVLSAVFVADRLALPLTLLRSDDADGPPPRRAALLARDRGVEVDHASLSERETLTNAGGSAVFRALTALELAKDEQQIGLSA